MITQQSEKCKKLCARQYLFIYLFNLKAIFLLGH